MKRSLLLILPFLVVVVCLVGCSSGDADPVSGMDSSVIAPTDVSSPGDGMHHHGDGGHHGDMGMCDETLCTCTDHQDCGGMMGQMQCDNDCAGCTDHCDHMPDGQGSGGKHHHEDGGHDGHDDHEHCQ